ncbi:hypothetical protein D9613_009521 [Agrocybe pediades]|uniref:Uncharacterized protein n=1 Tax=Agrocybe pediades TaxID=84607 RepID=A0A8H4VW23_9AGAR|nr:hypothetical protein D9613_009521 [Agrocybe pediades]
MHHFIYAEPADKDRFSLVLHQQRDSFIWSFILHTLQGPVYTWRVTKPHGSSWRLSASGPAAVPESESNIVAVIVVFDFEPQSTARTLRLLDDTCREVYNTLMSTSSAELGTLDFEWVTQVSINLNASQIIALTINPTHICNYATQLANSVLSERSRGNDFLPVVTIARSFPSPNSEQNT